MKKGSTIKDKMTSKPNSVAIVGAGIFGLSLAISMQERGWKVTVFDQNDYCGVGYEPDNSDFQAASVDHNKIFRASYGTKLHYQRLAIEGRCAWVAEDYDCAKGDDERLFVNSGMLRVQPSGCLDSLERETLVSMERDGLRDTQFVKSNTADRERARMMGWENKLLEFGNTQDLSPSKTTYEAVLDSLAGFVRCSSACAHYLKAATTKGVQVCLGPENGAFDSFIHQESLLEPGRKKVSGLKTMDSTVHYADVVVVAAGSFSTQILPGLSYHLESSAGSLVTFKIDKGNAELWEKYSPERFPVVTWKSKPRNGDTGTDTGSVYVLPRTPDGILKIGYRGIKFTNFQPVPDETPYSQDSKWSVPLPSAKSLSIPEQAVYAIRQFVSIFLPEFDGVPFHTTKLCWYTDSLDNSFVIDYVPDYAENSVFVCTGGSGHGAKFFPVLGEHAADILENGDNSSSYMRPFWRWRPDVPRRNGLEEGPDGPRNIGSRVSSG